LYVARCDIIDFACRPPIQRNHRCILHQNSSLQTDKQLSMLCWRHVGQTSV